MKSTPKEYSGYGLSLLFGVTWHLGRQMVWSVTKNPIRGNDGQLWVKADDLFRVMGAPVNWREDDRYKVDSITQEISRIVYDTREVAEILHTTKENVRSMIRSGELPGAKMYVKYFVLKPVFDSIIETMDH